MKDTTHARPEDETIVPQPRREGIEVSELHDELILFDTVERRAHALNRTVAAVWQACDGELSVQELRPRVEQRLGVPLAEDVIWLAHRTPPPTRQRRRPPPTLRLTRRCRPPAHQAGEAAAFRGRYEEQQQRMGRCPAS